MQIESAAMMDSGGFYCSTSGTVFADKDALTDHYKSDLHRYNLKRKVAGVNSRCPGYLNTARYGRNM